MLFVGLKPVRQKIDNCPIGADVAGFGDGIDFSAISEGMEMLRLIA